MNWQEAFYTIGYEIAGYLFGGLIGLAGGIILGHLLIALGVCQ